MLRKNNVANALVIGSLALSSTAFALCGPFSAARPNKAPVRTLKFVLEPNNPWKELAKFPAQMGPDGVEDATFKTDAAGWSLASIAISSPDWIRTTTYCYSPQKGLVSAELRFSCAWGWIASQSAIITNGLVHMTAVSFIDNKANRAIAQPANADEFADKFREFPIYRRVSDLPFAKARRKTGAVN